jgi:hypothetical protein
MFSLRAGNVLLLVLASGVAGTTARGAQERQVITITGDPAQLPPMPGFPGQRQFKTGTGRIRGRVLAAETGAPLRRAQVRISGQDVAPKTALTDAEGRYEFRELPAGRFSVMASKSGYVTVQYGQTRPFESGRPIELAEQQAADGADITMPRGGVISGRILDEFGEPVADANVTSVRQTWSGGRRRLVPAGRMAQTNDLGQFRLYGLPPGDYYVSATLRGAEPFMFDMMGGGGAGPAASGTASGYAPTYFPGSASASDAQKVNIAPGQEISGTDFALLPVRLSRIAGIVVGAEGKPLEGAMVNLIPAARGADPALAMMGNGTRTSKDGAFILNGVTPGDYTLQVRTVRIITGESGGGTMMFSARIGGEGDDAEFGSLPVSISGEDLPNVVINTSRGGTATGRLIFDGVTRPNTLGAMRVSAPPVDLEGPAAVIGGGNAAVKPDATFELKGVAGPRLIRVTSIPPGIMLKAVRLNGEDVTDTGVDFKNREQVSGLEVVLSKATEVTGSVTNSSGATVKDYTVVVFSEDPQRWTTPMTRWVSGARPNQEGRFKLSNLPAGSYYAIALDYVAQGEWGDPDLLERVKAKSKRFTLEDGEAKTLDLKISDVY